MAWLNKSIECAGLVMFRGKMPPQPEEFGHLSKQGLQIELADKSAHNHWTMQLRHSQWGAASLSCVKSMPAIPKVVIEYSSGLDDRDKELARLAESAVLVKVPGHRKNVLKDRKSLLFFLKAIMGDDALMANDTQSMKFWSREALEDEVVHDADVDIESLYTLHLVTDDVKPHWLHSHGLREIGFFDFDILSPDANLAGAARDAMRALAYSIVEEKVKPGTRKYGYAYPGMNVQLVDIRQFYAKASRNWLSIRGPFDAEHDTGRVVLCDLPGTGLLKWFDRPKAAQCLTSPFPDGAIVAFPHSATKLMAERAQKTFERFRQFTEEVSELGLMSLVKIGYVVDGGAAQDREHLWFHVHGCSNASIDATLLNEPHNVTKLKKGDRGLHSIEHLTDWLIATPVGHVSPRDTAPMRKLRANWNDIRQRMTKSRKSN